MNHVNIHCAFFFPQLYLIDVMMGKRANLDPRNKSEMFHTECFYSKGVSTFFTLIFVLGMPCVAAIISSLLC